MSISALQGFSTQVSVPASPRNHSRTLQKLRSKQLRLLLEYSLLNSYFHLKHTTLYI